MAVNMLMPQLAGAAPMAANDPMVRGVSAPALAGAGRQMTRSAAAMPSPQMTPAPQPKNALLQSLGTAIDGFRRGFDPQGWQQSRDTAKADQMDKAKQTLALMQQQRSLPEQQRAVWWKQNAPVISQIVGQDVSQMPLDPSKFTDQALDGQIAALSARLGMGPPTPEPMTAYQQALLNAPVKLGPGDVLGTVKDGEFDQIFSVPNRPTADGADLAHGGVQSVQPLSDGRLLKMFRDGTSQVVEDPASGKPAIARQNYGTLMAGDTPYMFNRNAGPGTLQQVVAPEKVGQDAATVAGITALGKAATDAKIQLPAAAAQLSNVIGVAEQLRNHEGFKGLYGGPVEAGAGAMGARFGADAEAQALVDQLGGEAFLQAVNALRGSGPISEREGLAAQQAQSRLKNYNQSDEAAQRALDDFIERAGNVYLLTMLKAKVPFSDQQLAALTPRQRALVAEWARVEGAQ